ncbi:MAG TPA: hypothetical protein VJ781_11290 [Pyrinomonadaceae bacterium]|nr:hypothetical protein [Pyrinomonadaceae bacterium]
MLRNRIVTRFVALFVVAFICLNAGGAVCVGYCQTFDSKVSSDHSSRQKVSGHCDRAAEHARDSNVVAETTREMDCCPFTTSFVAAPIEKQSLSLDSVATSPSQEAYVSFVFLAGRKESVIGNAYRGPPMDRRIDRLKNCIIRI